MLPTGKTVRTRLRRWWRRVILRRREATVSVTLTAQDTVSPALRRLEADLRRLAERTAMPMAEVNRRMQESVAAHNRAALTPKRLRELRERLDDLGKGNR